MPKKADPKKEGDKDEPGVASSFDVVLRSDKGKTQKITVAADKIAGADRPFLANWQWEELAVKATGKNAERLEWTHWDVREFARKTATIVIVDNRTGHFGHINADCFHFDITPRK